jgi:methylated-DNA-[protein]-cysteine S-methyltransferase
MSRKVSKQRAAATHSKPSRLADAEQIEMRLLTVHTTLGWIGVLSDGTQILKTKMGYASPELLHRACADWRAVAVRPNAVEKSWCDLLKRYAQGQDVDLQSLPLHSPRGTKFQQTVRAICRQIPAGQVMTYGQIAARAGAPQAARAVGTVMSKNEVPLLIPCHRVVGVCGLGGFSAPSGIKLKQQLLDLERNNSSQA